MFAQTPSSPRTSTARGGAPLRASATSRGANHARILAAAEQLVAERGAASLSIQELRSLTGLSDTALRRCFAGREEVALALHDQIAARVRSSMYRAYRSEESWLQGVRAAIAELLTTLQRNVSLARFVLVDCPIDEGRLPARRAELIGRFATALERELPVRDPGQAESPYGAYAMINAVAAILHGRLLEDPVPPLDDLLGPLTGLIAMPFLGPSAAREELTRGRPPGPSQGSGHPRRLTARTLAALRAIEARPGLSNKHVADAAGVADPGQISKLLGRLRSLDLIECEPESRGRPVAKAWRLTPAGRRVLRGTRRAA